MGHNIPIQFGISEEFSCDYLPQHKERLLVALDNIVYNPANYEKLMEMGFRRSGAQVYRPHCNLCSECQSIRIPVIKFAASKNQKRVIRKCANFMVKLNLNQTDPLTYYSLYENYINTRHADGSMYPANVEQYLSFVEAHWLQVGFLEIYDKQKLISVSVIDCLPNCYSAVYTFFDPDYQAYSLGTFAILQQIELTRLSARQFLYLGYQVDGCNKMNYKSKFYPHQRLVQNKWLNVEKTS
ncbi:arginyltransferase [Catenovulum sediminis]|uniref:Aspartate/glutamate leucyltransferase n=1 Tax=Catenovulum sediminis TaxID=1740262 RepID=A0ABV1RIJ8_9ALTE